MAEFAYSLDGGIGIIKDIALAATYNASTAKKGEFVVTDGAGALIKAGANAAKITGVLEGIEYTGLVPNTVNASQTASVVGAANGVGKVRIGREAVYRVAAGAIVAGDIGKAVGINAAQALDLAQVNKPLTILDVRDGLAFVSVAAV
jgi:hypothetical protein